MTRMELGSCWLPLRSVQKPSKTALGLHSGAALKDEIMLRFKSHASSIAKRGKRWLLKLVIALILLIIC